MAIARRHPTDSYAMDAEVTEAFGSTDGGVPISTAGPWPASDKWGIALAEARSTEPLVGYWGKLVGLNTRTKAVDWTHDYSEAVDAWGPVSSIQQACLIDDHGAQCFGTETAGAWPPPPWGDSNHWCRDIRTGQLKWSVSGGVVGDRFINNWKSCLLGLGSIAFSKRTTGGVHRIDVHDKSSGGVRWTYALPGPWPPSLVGNQPIGGTSLGGEDWVYWAGRVLVNGSIRSTMSPVWDAFADWARFFIDGTLYQIIIDGNAKVARWT